MPAIQIYAAAADYPEREKGENSTKKKRADEKGTCSWKKKASKS